MDAKPGILITCGTGKVGLETIKSLKVDGRSSNFIIKAGVRAQKGKESLDPFGVEAVNIDLMKEETILPALQGISNLFLILPTSIEAVEFAKRIIKAAKEANIQHLVCLSIMDCDSKDRYFHKQFKEIENEIQSSGVNWTILRSAFFQENFLNWKDMITQGHLQLDIGDRKVAPISIVDVGEVASEVLLGDSEKHHNKIYQLTGPELLTGKQMADVFSKVLGKEVNYSSRPEAKRGKFASLDESFYELIADGHGSKAHPDVEMLLGRSPRCMESTINSYKVLFINREYICISPQSENAQKCAV